MAGLSHRRGLPRLCRLLRLGGLFQTRRPLFGADVPGDDGSWPSLLEQVLHGVELLAGDREPGFGRLHGAGRLPRRVLALPLWRDFGDLHHLGLDTELMGHPRDLLLDGSQPIRLDGGWERDGGLNVIESFSGGGKNGLDACGKHFHQTYPTVSGIRS